MIGVPLTRSVCCLSSLLSSALRVSVFGDKVFAEVFCTGCEIVCDCLLKRSLKVNPWLNPKFFLKTSALALIALALVASPAWSQSSNGSVRGIVQDPTSAVIPNVTVVLTNTATGVELKTVSNGAGIYVFPSVSPGPYKITAESAGMNKFEATLQVQTQESASVTITFVPAGTKTCLLYTSAAADE